MCMSTEVHAQLEDIFGLFAASKLCPLCASGEESCGGAEPEIPRAHHLEGVCYLH